MCHTLSPSWQGNGQLLMWCGSASPRNPTVVLATGLAGLLPPSGHYLDHDVHSCAWASIYALGMARIQVHCHLLFRSMLGPFLPWELKSVSPWTPL